MKKYCEECGREVETKIITQNEVYDVCGEKIEVEAQVLVCAECGEDFYSEELDNATLIRAYNEYRRRHKLLLPEEIKKIREQYGLSQRGFAKLLNWGDKTICRYENGSIQDKAHNSLLLFLREPENMRTYLTENEISLDEKQKSRLLEIVEKLEQDNEYRVGRQFFDLIFSKDPCEGGEVPEGILSEDEIVILERIYKKLKAFHSIDMSNYFPKENGYKSTNQGEIISYSHAKDIQLN